MFAAGVGANLFGSGGGEFAKVLRGELAPR